MASWERQNHRENKRPVVARAQWGGVNRWGAEDFQSCEAALYDTIEDTSLQICLNPQNVQHDPYCKLWIFSDYDVSV